MAQGLATSAFASFARHGLGAALITWALGCAPAAIGAAPDPYLKPVGVSDVGPATLLPGTLLRVEGAGFLDPEFGSNEVQFSGTAAGRAVEHSAPARYVSESVLELDIDAQLFAALGDDGATFDGALRVLVENRAAESERASDPVAFRVNLARELMPAVTAVASDEPIYVNDLVPVEGSGFLLGGAEGTTYARLGGCFYPQGSVTCVAVDTQELPLSPQVRHSRERAYFTFLVSLTGLRPGIFRGTFSLINRHDGGVERATPDRQLEIAVRSTEVTGVDTAEASLGQYVEVTGGGFVGGTEGAITLLEITGDYVSDASGNERPIDLLLVPAYESGRRVRYVLNEEDELGAAVNLRREPGVIAGTVRPITRYGGDEVRGAPVPFAFHVAPLKQVITVVFLPSFVESLGRFGLRAADDLIRERVLAVAAEPYAGINVEFRPDLPADFALYSVVELSGEDPNGQGLFGYDNTPGKDTNNERLTDRIGGVNAQTQGDGFPGYGGVFIDSFFEFARGGDIADPLFDRVFDPFRRRRGGRAVTDADLAAGIPEVTDPTRCQEKGLARSARIACAVHAIGSLIGSTLSHEVGHSLGLANPYDPAEFHNFGDEPRRIMDAGSARPFVERTNLDGVGASHFCVEEYEYLRALMPRGDPDDRDRPACF